MLNRILHGLVPLLFSRPAGGFSRRRGRKALALSVLSAGVCWRDNVFVLPTTYSDLLLMEKRWMDCGCCCMSCACRSWLGFIWRVRGARAIRHRHRRECAAWFAARYGMQITRTLSNSHRHCGVSTYRLELIGAGLFFRASRSTIFTSARQVIFSSNIARVSHPSHITSFLSPNPCH